MEQKLLSFKLSPLTNAIIIERHSKKLSDNLKDIFEVLIGADKGAMSALSSNNRRCERSVSRLPGHCEL